ncbi:MAG: winged helix-turn-helix transcriptional regulator [Ruminococcaceae bacterium]|nr:winged helix-turn-helix transcriptional regulator [Oscillospiraceae bacterium]
MIRRFEEFTRNIAMAYKYVIRIKAYEMNTFGLKGSHVMCLYYIGKNPEGNTAFELCSLCNEDKSQVSKAISYLLRVGYITPDKKSGTRKYKIRYIITPKGQEVYNAVNKLILGVLARCEDGLTEDELFKFYETFEKINKKLKTIQEEMSHY